MITEMVLKVGMAELKVHVLKGILKTTGLGSCVGVTLYDSVVKVAGKAHVMLPNSNIAKEGILNTAKYADTAIVELIKRMEQFGASKKRMEAILVGGAQMFVFSGNSDTMRIAPRNVESCRTILYQNSIPIKAEDTGGNYGRTIEFYLQTGKLLIRTVGQGVKEI